VALFLEISVVTSIPQGQPAEMELLGFREPLKCCLLPVVYNNLWNRERARHQSWILRDLPNTS